jgi:serine/tyrosine/threonine adenylyltransferase
MTRRDLHDPKAGWNLGQSYAQLPSDFYTELPATPVAAPRLVYLNDELASALGFNAEALRHEANVAIMAGNSLPSGARPLAQAYAGHQFGHFNSLGDGRALLLGEQVAPDGQRWDLHLKGSGPTPYSRRGDGRAALGPMLREVLIGEALHALHVPTTRCLAVVATGESIRRETFLPGAVLTRVAASHLRVGTMEWAASLSHPGGLKALADYALARHDPAAQSAPEPYRAQFLGILERQASLIARWQSLGFVHGVMNTDNMALSGESIDFGPCAWMEAYDPATVFSSIDRGGRYAYGNQPTIAQWNLARLAEAMLPLLGPEPEEAVAWANEAISSFTATFEHHWESLMAAKLGLPPLTDTTRPLIHELLNWMHSERADFTNTFVALTRAETPSGLETWAHTWRASARPDGNALMRASNPIIIPRNHHVEAALAAATSGDLSLFEALLKACQNPFDYDHAPLSLQSHAPADSEPYCTYCGT